MVPLLKLYYLRRKMGRVNSLACCLVVAPDEENALVIAGEYVDAAYPAEREIWKNPDQIEITELSYLPYENLIGVSDGFVIGFKLQLLPFMDMLISNLSR